MSIPMRKALPLFLLLCMFLCLCLLPAAYAEDEGDPPEDLMAEFLQAVADGEDNFDIAGRGAFTLTDSIEIPADMQVRADAIIVPADMTLTLAGKLQAGAIDVAEGGAVIVNSTAKAEVQDSLHLAGDLTLNDVWIRISGQIWAAWADSHDDANIEYNGDSGVQAWLYVNNLFELRFALDAAAAYHQENENFMLFVHTGFFIPVGQDTTIPGYVALHMHDDWFVVEEGATLTIEEGAFVDFSGGSAAINGSVVNNGTLHIYKDENCDSRINFHEGSSYTGSGLLYLESRVGNPFDLVGGALNLSELVPERISIGRIELRIPESAADALTTVCANTYGESYYYHFPGEGTVTLTGELTIPENLTIDARDVSFVLDEGAALTVPGSATLLTGSFAYNHGAVTVDGFLYAEDNFTVGDGLTEDGSFLLYGTLSIENNAISPQQLSAIKNVEGSALSYGGGAVLDLSYNLYNEADLLAVLGEADTTAQFRRSVWLLSYWEMENAFDDEADTFTLPDQVRLCVSNDGYGQDGSLVIPEGKTLVIPESSELYARGAVGDGQCAIVRVEGSLVNNGAIRLDWYNDSLADITLGANGSFTNNNEDEWAVTRGGNPYTILSEPEDEAILDLRAAIRDGDFPNGEYNFTDKGDVTLTRDMTIPANVLVRARGTNLTVAEGATLTVRGSFNFTDLIVNGSVRFERDGRSQVYGNFAINSESGGVDVAENSRLEVLQQVGTLTLGYTDALRFHDNSTGQITLLSTDDLHHSIGIYNEDGVDLLFIAKGEGDNCDALVLDAKACMEGLAGLYGDRANYSVIVGSPWTLTEDLIFENVGLCSFSPVTVPQGTTLEAGYLEMRGAPLTVAGTLINHGTLRLAENTVNVEGESTTYYGTLNVEEGGSFEGRGQLRVTSAVPAEAEVLALISGVNDLSLQARENGEDDWILVNAGYLYGAVLSAIDNGEEYFDLSNQGDFILPGDLRLPAGFYLETANTKIIVPGPAEDEEEGVTLTVASGNWTDMETLRIREGGSLTLEPGSRFTIYHYLNNGTVTVGEEATDESEGGGAQLDIWVYEVNADLGLGVINTPFGRDTTIWYHYQPEDAEELYDMIAEADTLEYPYEGNIHVHFDWTLEGTEEEPVSVSFDAREANSTSLDVNWDGSLTVGPYATLTLNSWANVSASNVTVLKAAGWSTMAMFTSGSTENQTPARSPFVKAAYTKAAASLSCRIPTLRKLMY